MRGINIDNIYDPNLKQKLERIKGPRPIARIVVDNPFENQLDRLRAIVPLVKQYAEPLIQCQDSFGEKDLTDEYLFKKAEILFHEFSDDCKLWEISNESNGAWCSPNVAERAQTIFTMMPEDAKGLLTLFWGESNLMEWYKKHPLKTHYVGISFYPHNWSDVRVFDPNYYAHEFSLINPGCKVFISEVGLEEWNGTKSFRTEQQLIRRLEEKPITHSAWENIIIPWDWQEKA